MSKLRELIKELCPDGVEYRKIEECCLLIAGGDIPKKNFSKEENSTFKIPIVSNGTGKNSIKGYTNKATVIDNCVTIAARGTIGYISVWEKPIFPVVRLICVIPKNYILLKFLYYYLQHVKFKTPKSGIPQLTIPMIKNYKLPLPPLPIQEEIVSILDKYTEPETELETKLQAEFEARKKQYEYYRNKLLSFEDDASVKWMKLGEVATLIRGPFGGSLKKNCFVSNGYAVYEQQHAIYGIDKFRYFITTDKYNELIRFTVRTGDLIMSCSGTMGKFSIIPEQAPLGIINQALLKLTPKPFITNKFLWHYFNTYNFTNQLIFNTKGGAIKNVASVVILKEIKIPVPSLDKQQRIVSILDRFDALCHDIFIGLPAEIAARKKQYEYYRDKLLTFKEKTA